MTSYWHKAAAQAQGQVRCDVIQAQFRSEPEPRRSIRRDPPAAPPALAPTDDPLTLRLAEELEYARRMLQLMGDDLAGDAAVVVRHPRSLQSIDIVGQMIGHIASVVRCSDPAAAVDCIGMVELKARLMRRSVV